MTPIIWTVMITSLSTSTIITAMSHHWMLAWLGLELNSLSVLPIIMKSHHPRATEATTKYFLIQATGAALILFASTINAWQTGQWAIMHTPCQISSLIMVIALALKLGAAPMHAWYPEVMQGCTMTTALIMSTWQKIAPLTLLYMMMNTQQNTPLLMLGLISALLGGWMGLNQTQTRKLMAFSSIAHLGWLLTALTLNPTITTLTFVTYIIMTSAMFTMLHITTTKTLTDTTTLWSNTPIMMTTMMMILMTLAGLPPLTGFMPKWLILQELVTLHTTALALTLTLATLPSLFFYTRMAYLTTMTTPPNTAATTTKWRFNTTKPSLLTPMITSATMLLPLTPMLISL
uniref:NADH-ubiquinone oxidoreductase chain 2 n=1 Tax=Ancylodactylus africanus TaxID=3147773 RepID=J7G4R1_9SAUR|nr:NADH dehydrogenase subunit 2 [Cnemaspis africana]